MALCHEACHDSMCAFRATFRKSCSLTRSKVTEQEKGS